MLAIHPAVQDIRRGRRMVSASSVSDEKRIANRRHRRALNRVTRGFARDPEAFDAEDFAAPSYSDWDIW